MEPGNGYYYGAPKEVNVSMDYYDPKFVPPPFRLQNSGSQICHLNSLLQVLVGCSSFVKAVLANEKLLSRTRTGKEIYAFITTFVNEKGMKNNFQDTIGGFSQRVIQALVSDLKEKREWINFGNAQESASEGLILLLDMMDADNGEVESPITRLFTHRFSCEMYCKTCKIPVSTTIDTSCQFNLFYYDRLKVFPSNPKTFSDEMRRYVDLTEDYRCEKCEEVRIDQYMREGMPPQEAVQKVAKNPIRKTGYRLYKLVMTPEIIICLFNAYGVNVQRRARYFPNYLEYPAKNGGILIYRLVGQIEHSGNLHGGHYVARSLRQGTVWLFNDSSTPIKTTFSSIPGTYILAYHVDRTIKKKSNRDRKYKKPLTN